MKNSATFLPLFTLALGCIYSLPAKAHVTIDPKNAPAGEYAKLIFRVPHGCDGSPTTKLTIRVPEGVVSVKPQVHPGWKISTKTAKYAKPVELHGKEVLEGISEVTWSGGLLDDAYMDEFGLSVKLPNKPGEKLLFPAIQGCKKGKSEWIAEKVDGHGGHGGPLPAPVLELNSKP